MNYVTVLIVANSVLLVGNTALLILNARNMGRLRRANAQAQETLEQARQLS